MMQFKKLKRACFGEQPKQNLPDGETDPKRNSTTAKRTKKHCPYGEMTGGAKRLQRKRTPKKILAANGWPSFVRHKKPGVRQAAH